MVEIIQISDIHFGSEFREDYFDNVIQYIKDNKPDAVVCTGDIVHKGRYTQYQNIIPYIKRLKESTKHFMVIPGNHDAKNNGLIFFERFIAPRRSKMVLEEKNTIIVGICSAKDDVSIGEIGDEQLDYLGRMLNAESCDCRAI